MKAILPRQRSPRTSFASAGVAEPRQLSSFPLSGREKQPENIDSQYV